MSKKIALFYKVELLLYKNVYLCIINKNKTRYYIN